MTTAVAPKNAKNWSEVFPEDQGYPDEGKHWQTINDILYNVALCVRFGFTGMPHDYETDKWSSVSKCAKCDKPKKDHPIELSTMEQVVLASFRSWCQQSVILEAKFGSDEWNQIVKELGTSMMFKILIANADPVVGHFVGRGFDQNEQDADAFLGTKKGKK